MITYNPNGLIYSEWCWKHW